MMTDFEGSRHSAIVSCGTRKDIDSALSSVSIILGFIGSTNAELHLGTSVARWTRVALHFLACSQVQINLDVMKYI